MHKPVIVCSLLFLAVFIQRLMAQHPQFEVATIRAIDINSNERTACMQRMVERLNSPGRFNDCNFMGQLFIRAAGLPASQIEGLDRLPGQTMYEVQATYTSTASDSEIRSMLAALLAERLQLKTHTETRETSLYELSIVPSGHKLTEADGSNTPTSLPDARNFKEQSNGLPEIPAVPGRIVWMPGSADTRGRGTRVPMTKLVDFIATDLGAPVLDRTGLSANYNFTLEFANSRARAVPGTIAVASGAATSTEAEAKAADPARFPPLTTALRDQLGLRLEKKKGPATFLIIDSSASKPIDN